MIITTLITGSLFIAIGFFVTEKNASQLLAGYNTLSKEKQGEFKLKNFIPFFRKFHILLGLSFIVLVFIIQFIFSTKASSVFIVAYPLLAYGFLLWKIRSCFLKECQ